jgi:hypothetical protein
MLFLCTKGQSHPVGKCSSTIITIKETIFGRLCALQLCGHSPCAYLGQSKLGVGEDMVVTTVMQAKSSAGVIFEKELYKHKQRVGIMKLGQQIHILRFWVDEKGDNVCT